MECLNLPDAALLHVLVLEHAEAPARVLVVYGLLREHVPTTLRRAAVRRDVHDRLQLHLIEEQVRLRRLGAVELQEREDVLLADIHTAAADFDRTVRGEEIGGFRPELFFGVEAVNFLQILHRLLALETRDVVLERRGARAERIERRSLTRVGARTRAA